MHTLPDEKLESLLITDDGFISCFSVAPSISILLLSFKATALMDHIFVALIKLD